MLYIARGATIYFLVLLFAPSNIISFAPAQRSLFGFRTNLVSILI